MTCLSASAGAQKELDQWPLFQELLSLMPSQSIHIHFVSPEVPHHLDGVHKTSTLQQGAASRATETAVDSSVDAVPDATQRQQAAPESQSSNQRDSAADQAHNYCSAEHVSAPAGKGLQQALTVQSGDAPMHAHRHTGSSVLPALQVSFHRGFYHDVAADLHQQSETADFIFGANAGKPFAHV